AGGSRLLLRRRGENRVELVRLCGLWLGLDRPLAEDQQACALAEGDELLIGTDGAFDQLIDYEGSSAGLTDLIDGSLGTGDVLGAMQGMLERALQERPQKDDITLVMMRRQRRAL
ncbi:MAG TPA: SpoIIE family protein phosphatase, partial [Gemmataceae bacterium]|nr:SpoIIE family protein phosphatase [Gemmataceae bacterium]